MENVTALSNHWWDTTRDLYRTYYPHGVVHSAGSSSPCPTDTVRVPVSTSSSSEPMVFPRSFEAHLHASGTEDRAHEVVVHRAVSADISEPREDESGPALTANEDEAAAKALDKYRQNQTNSVLAAGDPSQ